MATEPIPYDTPALKPPAGIESNFIDPPSLHAWTLGVGTTCMAIMTLAVAIRTYTKAIIIKEMRHEDYVAIVALLCNVFQMIYPPSMGAAKYFVCIQLKRIFSPRRSSGGAVRWALNGLIAATIMYSIACFFTFTFQCIPRDKIWNPEVAGKCIDNSAGVLSAGLINLLLDLGILVVPVWAIWHLQMPLKRKIGAMSVFAIGIFTCTIAAFGVAYRIPLLRDADQTIAIARVGLWTLAELVGTTVVGCMPMFPRFYEKSALIQGPISTIQSVTSLLTLRSQRSPAVYSSKNSQLSRRPPFTKSADPVVVTMDFTRDEIRLRPESIELREALVLVATAVLRRYFSAISDVPGPFWASITRLWHIYYIYNGDHNTRVMKLHKKHGHFVRIAPNEVSISHPDGPDLLLQKPLRKGDWYRVFTIPDYTYATPQSTLDPKEKMERSRMFAPGFILSYLLRSEAHFDVNMTHLFDWMDEYSKTHEPTHLDKFFSYVTFDNAGDAIFSRSFGFTKAGQDIGGSIANSRSLNCYMAIAGYHVWIHRLFVANPIITWSGLLPMGHLFKTSMEALRQRKKDPDARFDIVAHWLKAHHERPDLFSYRDVEAQTTTSIAAASDTLSCLLIAPKSINTD
ncbi:hypothetical protein H634G_10073 [Metarhizium anisopliae BRIP 53293]|uniref:Rhodopsin domain-containing protein n=1 Tax=Metarhizium anisopliae BRIP 53293 TaxID=1291518 RepID=A0A0D9NLK3_METAN|nr:hypothetical protein H634G_10073 [Metarhizium anisopliae BRIP 53293]KJK86945.1 hypothetical protein H633G_09219 [Metarhizium anisopliae BRIP 53284]